MNEAASSDEVERLRGALAEVSARYAELFVANPNPMLVYDLEDLRILEVNDALVASHGYSAEALLTMRLTDLHPPELHAALFDNVRAVTDGLDEAGRWKHRRADGSLIDVEITSHTATWDGRAAEVVLINLLDDDALVRAREAEERARSTARRLVDRLTAIVATWRSLSDGDPAPDELYDALPSLVGEVLDAQGVALFLLHRDRLVPRSFAGYTQQAPEIPVEGSLSGEALRTGRTVRIDDLAALDIPGLFESMIPRPEGSRSVLFTAVQGADGPIGVISVLDRRPGHFDDADERSLEILAEALGAMIRRVTAESERRRNAELFRLISEATTDAIYDWDLQRRERSWGEGLDELFGWNFDGSIPVEQRWNELVHPDDRERVRAGVRSFIRDPAAEYWGGEYRFQRADGSYVLIREHMHAVRRPDGRVVRVVGGLTDITAEVEAQARAQRAQRLEAIGQLTGGVAHDFNNLLTVILGTTDHLLLELSEWPDLQELAEMARAAALRGAELSHRLLAFARRQPLEPEHTRIEELIAELVPFLERTLREDITVVVDHTTDPWPVYVDPAQLESALLNLCLNARDAMPEGGELTIATANLPAALLAVGDSLPMSGADYVLITVTDSGRGIDTELLERVFEPFFTTKEAGAGSGLGLSMVHGFVNQSGGQVTITSELGRGTTVRMYLPRASDNELPSQPIPAAAVAGDSGGEHILLVEDEDAVRDLAARHLRHLGYAVTTASGGAEAVELLERAGPFDLLFTDVVMPGGIGGGELAAIATARAPALPVLFTSGYAADAIVHDGRLDSGVELLAKPYRLDVLAQRVRAILNEAVGSSVMGESSDGSRGIADAG